MPFQYTFRSDDITTWDVDTRDLLENRDRELELYSTTIDNSFLNLNASNLTSGTVPSARMTGAYTGITGLGTLTGLASSGQITVLRGSLGTLASNFLTAINTYAETSDGDSLLTRIRRINNGSTWQTAAWRISRQVGSTNMGFVQFGDGAGGQFVQFGIDNTVYGYVGAGGFFGALTGNASTATNLSTNRTNWSTNGTISAVVGQLAWKNYGNSHTIFDASQSTSPNGGAVNNTNAQIAWTGTYPTLMGWNGANTYGVRVDSARIADIASSVGTLSSLTVNGTILTNGNPIGSLSTYCGAIYSNNWFRSSGTTGWYSETYAAGIYSKATKQVWTYNASRFIASTNSSGSDYNSQQLEVRSNDLFSGGSVAGISFHVYGANAPVLRYWTGTGAGLDVGNEGGSGYWYMGANNFVTRSSMRWKTDIRRRPQEQIVEVGLRLLEGETAIWDSKDIEPIFDEENECYIQPCAEQRELVKDDWIQRRHFNKRGYIVEELEKVFPEAVHYESDGKPSGVDYGVITTELVDILKLVVLQNSDQQRRIELLENKRR